MQNANKAKVMRLKDILENQIFFKSFIPPGMRRRSDVSFRSHLGWDVADHIETSSRRCY